MLDEKTAVKLFRTGEPIDRFITISDTKFRIVGIIKHSRQASDMEELRLTIPLAALDKQEYNLMCIPPILERFRARSLF